MDELKRCLFCGDNRAYIIEKSTTTTIACPQCHAMIEDVLEEDAVKKWNTRKPVENVLNQLEELKNTEIKVIGGRCNGKSFTAGYSEGIREAINIIKAELGG